MTSHRTSNPSAGSRPARLRRLALGISALLAVAGLILLEDVLFGAGAARGMGRHRIVAIALGSGLLVPAFVSLVAPRRGARLIGKLYLLSIPLLVVLLVLEGALRIGRVEATRSFAMVEDDTLGYIASSGPGIDAWGFRNEEVPDHAAVVCIGDSQTFGFHVRDSETWPARLAEITGLEVYNMSSGGYGPLQYMELARAAQRLRPRNLVVALYLGNDFPDAWRWASRERWSAFRDPTTHYPPPQEIPRSPRAPNLATACLEKLTESSRLLGWVRDAVAQRLKNSRHLAELYSGESGAPAYEGGRISTRFTPRYRLPLIDLEEPGTRDGFRITTACLEQVRDTCAANDMTCWILILGTKEACYQELMARQGLPGFEALDRLATKESALIARLVETLQRLEVRLIDPRPALLAALEADRPPWLATADGHFSAEGCRILAEVVAEALRNE